MLGGAPAPPRPPPLLPPSAIRTAKFELNHLIDAAKQKAASKYESIKFESIESVFNHLIDAGKQKPASIKWEPVRIVQGESTKAVRQSEGLAPERRIFFLCALGWGSAESAGIFFSCRVVWVRFSMNI